MKQLPIFVLSVLMTIAGFLYIGWFGAIIGGIGGLAIGNLLWDKKQKPEEVKTNEK